MKIFVLHDKSGRIRGTLVATADFYRVGSKSGSGLSVTSLTTNDMTADFHIYTIDWRPGRIAWLVDGRVLHERVGWDPTPLPHLPMRLHANLWAPRSAELAGRIGEGTLPATATFRDISVRA